jgi:aminoglycoside 6'-N-acetyltransferase
MLVEHHFTFEPVGPQHLPILRTWFHMPHVTQWWHDYAATLRELEFGKESDSVRPYVAYLNGHAFAYIQSWTPTENDDYPWQRGMPPDVRGMDLFIGPPDQLNKGLGPLLIQAFAAKLRREGAKQIVIDPNIGNARAIRAYQKAGFKKISDIRDIDGEGILMELSSMSMT